MFTGIITDIGRLRSIEPRGDLRLSIETAYDTSSIDMGASIACHGVCLTVVDKGPGWFAVDVSKETLDRTAYAAMKEGAPINLERSLRVGDELGGHIVTGHVDGLSKVVKIEPVGDSRRFIFALPKALAPYVAEKGSVALNGASLTVNAVNGDSFEINIIPHTQDRTTFGVMAEGDPVNMEIDVLARYVARLAETKT
ncbi:MAG: riboflavin synthase [Minwuia sp.]|uniref:riboflavin synthase n=1 Tax=Minwuia sp. TaxID=2493630 RepID=UPI003A8AEA99